MAKTKALFLAVLAASTFASAPTLAHHLSKPGWEAQTIRFFESRRTLTFDRSAHVSPRRPGWEIQTIRFFESRLGRNRTRPTMPIHITRSVLPNARSKSVVVFNPIRGFRGTDALLYRLTHLEEFPPLERQWILAHGQELDAYEQQRGLVQLMVRTEDIKVRHKLLVEVLENIPASIEALRDLVTLVPKNQVPAIQRQIELSEQLYAHYASNDLDPPKLLGVVQRNRSRLLGTSDLR